MFNAPKLLVVHPCDRSRRAAKIRARTGQRRQRLIGGSYRLRSHNTCLYICCGDDKQIQASGLINVTGPLTARTIPPASGQSVKRDYPVAPLMRPKQSFSMIRMIYDQLKIHHCQLHWPKNSLLRVSNSSAEAVLSFDVGRLMLSGESTLSSGSPVPASLSSAGSLLLCGSFALGGMVNSTRARQ